MLTFIVSAAFFFFPSSFYFYLLIIPTSVETDVLLQHTKKIVLLQEVPETS